ncbi:hypothetical protein, partial [Klebsiella aerogenes]|uniref:hypothetical protein n=1 Tax=Klebsiella aerogenes TaxID=548 RepID=UPI0019537978
ARPRGAPGGLAAEVAPRETAADSRRLEVGRRDPEVALRLDRLDVAEDPGPGVDDQRRDVQQHAAALEQRLVLDRPPQGQDARLVMPGDVV